MTGRERVLRTLNRQQTDYAPTMEWIINSDVMRAICGTGDQVEFVQKMDMDAVCVSLNNKNKSATKDGREIVDEWGVTRITYDEYPMPVGFPIKEMKDFEQYEVPDPDAPYRFDNIKAALKAVGDERCVVARVKDVVSMPRDLMSFEEFLANLYLDPDLVTALMKMSCDYSCRICEHLKDLGVEVIVLGDDIANNNALLMSPPMYRELVLPHFAKLVGHAKKLGLKVIKHSDGDLNSIVDNLVESGIDCLDPIDKRGNMDMKALKAKYGNRIALKGNVDCVSTLVDQPLHKVRQETAQTILAGGIGGGLILSSSNSIHSGVSPENWKYFLEIRKELSRTPLDIDKLTKIAAGE